MTICISALCQYSCMGAAPAFINRGIVVIKFIVEIFKVNKFSRIDFGMIMNRSVEETKA